MSAYVDRSDEVQEMYADENDDVLAGMFNGAWLDTQEFPPLEYAVPGIIPEGFGLLVSPPKAGKSWLVCGIGLACATGGLALGRIEVDKRPVLYLALDDGQRRLQSRCRRILCGQPIPGGIHFVTKARPSEVIPMISEFLERYKGETPMIIVDTLGKARALRPPGADLYAWDYAIGTLFKDAIDASPGATLLVVHHTRKMESSDFVDSVSGSQGVAGSADFVLVLSRKRHEDAAVLSVTGRDMAEGEYALTADGGLWRLDGTDLATAAETADARRSATQLGDAILDVLSVVRESDDLVTPAIVAAKLGMDPKTASKYLTRLDDRGDIIKAGRGKYMSKVSKVSKDSHPPSSATSDNPIQFDTFDTSDTHSEGT
jgi:hypothetical protein